MRERDISDRVYLITGESFLADEALDRLRAESGLDPLAETSFEASAPAGDILAALETPSLLGGGRLVIVNDAHDLKPQQIDAIQTYLESPSPGSVLVLVASGRTRLATAVKSAGSVISLDPPKGRRLVSWVTRRAREHSLRLEEAAARALVAAIGVDLRALDGGLQQLSTALGPSGEASAEDIERMFLRHAEERIYAFTDAVGDRKMPMAMESLRRLLDQGDPPLVLFGALTAHLRRMLVARHHSSGGPGAVGAALGLPDWRAERLLRQARSYREDELVAGLEVLAVTDVEMKGGDLSPELALERAVIRLVAGA